MFVLRNTFKHWVEGYNPEDDELVTETHYISDIRGRFSSNISDAMTWDSLKAANRAIKKIKYDYVEVVELL